jgi:hypothetical protein
MKGYLRAFKAVNLVWLAIVFLILILAAVPAIPGTVSIKLPGADGWTTTEVNGTINITGNVGVHNGGVFPLNNFFFFVLLMDDNGNAIGRCESPVITLAPGPWSYFPISFEFSDADSTSADIQALFFSKVTFLGMVYFNADYIISFNIQAMLIGNVSMGPLVTDYQVHTEQASVLEFEHEYLLDIPYDITTSYLLLGQGLGINGTVSDDAGVIGVFSTMAPLGGSSSGNITMALTKEAYLHLKGSTDTLFMNSTMTFGPFHWPQNFTVAWVPPPPAEEAASSAVSAVAPSGGC